MRKNQRINEYLMHSFSIYLNTYNLYYKQKYLKILVLQETFIKQTNIIVIIAL